jgi:hypothetical protein
MKTPMQEMFDQLKASKNDEYGLAFAIDMLLENEESMLQKEKVAIMNAYQEGKWTGWQNHKLKINNKEYQWTDHAEYFNETFNTK